MAPIVSPERVKQSEEYWKALDLAIEEYKSGKIKVLGLVYKWAQLSCQFDKFFPYAAESTASHLGISKAAFYRAMARLESERKIATVSMPLVYIPNGSELAVPSLCASEPQQSCDERGSL